MPLARVAVPEAAVEPDPAPDVVLVPLGVPVVTVLFPATALLRLPMIPLADGRGMATSVVLGLGAGAGGRDVSRPTGMPDGPVGLKLAGLVLGRG